MKVVISAAGEGTRMRPLTKNKSKHLILVRNRPFIFYLLDNVFKAGYREIILVIGYKAEKFKKTIKKYKIPKRAKIQFINQFEVLGKRKYGTACPLMCVKDIIKNENFLMMAGDNFYLAKDLKKFKVDDNYNYIAGFCHKLAEKYGFLLVDNKGFLKKIIEKPSSSQISKINLRTQEKYIENLINISLYRFTPEVFKKLPKIKKSRRGEYEITDVISLLAKEKKVKVKKLKDFWMDFGNPADIKKFSKFLKSFPVY